MGDGHLCGVRRPRVHKRSASRSRPTIPVCSRPSRRSPPTGPSRTHRPPMRTAPPLCPSSPTTTEVQRAAASTRVARPRSRSRSSRSTTRRRARSVGTRSRCRFSGGGRCRDSRRRRRGRPTSRGSTRRSSSRRTGQTCSSCRRSISADGTLTYTPRLLALGVATVTVRVVDDGGTANGGADTSAPTSFTITIV